MASRAELDQLVRAQSELTAKAKDALRQLFGRLSLTDPYAARDALLEAVPQLVSTFGDLSGAVAMEWFEDVYDMPAALADPFNADQVRGSVRYAAGHLFTDSPAQMLVPLSQAVSRLVHQSGRDTLTASSTKHGLRYVRVPRGAHTCSFCLMLASRTGQWAYSSKKEAQFRSSDGHKYHDDCDCEPMPVRDGDSPPDGFELGKYTAMYRAATKSAGSTSDTESILAEMRRIYPDAVSDGVLPH